MSVVRSLLPGRRQSADAMFDCPQCATPFRPARTRGECPVCGWRHESVARRLSLGSADSIDVAVVVVVTLVNLALLGLLALVVFRQ